MTGRGINIIFRDVIFLALLGFVAIVVLILPWINPDANELDKPPGDLIFEISWDPKCDTDVDLWLRAPGDRPVGYSNKNGIVIDLLRDDLGFYRDEGVANIEFAYARWEADGEYIVNVHLYKADKKCPLPVKVYTRVYRRSAPKHSVLEKTVALGAVGQELTVGRFTMTDGKASNMHDLPVGLRTADK
jgi:hypothetical protein